MQKRYEWLEYVKKKDEKEKMEEMHQRKVEEEMIKSAEGSAGLLHKITMPTMWKRRNADSEGGRRRREIARSLCGEERMAKA